MRTRFAIATALALLMSCCAGTPALTDAEKSTAYRTYQENPFAPINVYVNPGKKVTELQSREEEYIKQQIANSRAFIQPSMGVARWPYSLEIQYAVSAETTAKGLAGAVVLGGTLGLVPTEFDQQYSFKVTIYQGPLIVNAFELEEDIKAVLSIYKFGKEDEVARPAIDRLIIRMLQEISDQKLLPRASDFIKKPAIQSNS